MTSRWAAPAAALLWALLAVRWFDVAAPWRPRGLAALPPLLLFAALVLALAALARRHGPMVFRLAPGASRAELGLFVLLAFFFRLPMAWTGAAGYTTPDGSLSGIVALRLRDGLDHLVFVPSVPYSGSLKSHLAAALGHVLDLSTAFTLSSVLFYAAFVAALYALAAALDPARARFAALYAAFAPAFVTRYSLSNDGNYVEVLALGTFALWLAARAHGAADSERHVMAWAAGLALGLAFWAHLLAVIPAAAVALTFVAVAPARVLGTSLRLAGGFACGAWPALLWNAANDGESFRYLLPGGQSVGSLDSGPPVSARVLGLVTDHVPVLAGYDPGYAPALDIVLRILAWAASGAIVVAYAVALRRFAQRRDFVRGALLGFTLANVAAAAFALPYIPGNARYLLFLVAPVAVFLADAFGEGRRRWVLVLLVAFGALTSLGQWPSARRSDARWRGFVRELEASGVTHCYTDFSLAAKIDLLSEERVVCASDLGPTTTEYFKDYPTRVAAAEGAALIAINTTAADKLERRLQRLGVRYERRDGMKPTLVPERNVHPSELFPTRNTVGDD